MDKPRILICEDEGIVAIHIRSLLLAKGYAVAGVASSGEDAYQKALETRPDLVLMDIKLEGPTDGIAAAERIREQLDIPLVYLTAYADEETLRRAKVTEPYGYLAKPFEDRDLYIAIQIALNRSTTDRKLRARERHLSLVNAITQAALATPDMKTLLQVLANQLGALVQADHCFIALWDENKQTNFPAAVSGTLPASSLQRSFGPDENAWFSEVLRSGQPLVVDDCETSPRLSQQAREALPSRALMALPLVAGAKQLGVAVLGFQQAHAFSEEEIGQCQQAAGLVALAMDKVHLLEETQQRAEELTIVTEVSAAMRAAHTRAEIPPIVVEQLTRLLKVETIALVTCNPDEHTLFVEMASGRWARLAQTALPDNEQVTWRVVDSRQPYVNNQFRAAAGGSVSALYDEAIRCAVCTPLIVREQSIGAIWMGGVTRIENKDLNLLAAISNMAANALQRQALYQDLQEQLATLQKTKDLLVQTEKLAAIGELVAGVAHELNNPLTTIMLYTELLEQRVTAEDARLDLQKIVAEARRTARIVRGLLDFSRQRAPEKKAIQVNDVIHSSLDFMAYEMKTHNISWSVETNPYLPVTMADPHQLQQVFINLINNAWQAMAAYRKRGHLTIVSEVGNTAYPAASSRELFIRVRFIDDGPGIAPEVLLHIFDPFFTTRTEGTGLGLSICHGIINEHGGNIWAESGAEQGTIFSVELPVITSTIASRAKPGREPGYTPVEITGRILIIDDEPNILEVMSRALRRRGYAMDAAGSGVLGLDLLGENEYDLIVCDLCMPGMNGQEFYQQVKALNADLARHMIFTSGDLISPQSQRFIKENELAFIPKPFNLNDLIDLIQTTLVLQAKRF